MAALPIHDTLPVSDSPQPELPLPSYKASHGQLSHLSLPGPFTELPLLCPPPVTVDVTSPTPVRTSPPAQLLPPLNDPDCMPSPAELLSTSLANPDSLPLSCPDTPCGLVRRPGRRGSTSSWRSIVRSASPSALDDGLPVGSPGPSRDPSNLSDNEPRTPSRTYSKDSTKSRLSNLSSSYATSLYSTDSPPSELKASDEPIPLPTASALGPKKKSLLSLASASFNMGALCLADTRTAATLRVYNETGWNLRIAQWPTKVKKRRHTHYALSRFRGSCFDQDSIPQVTETLSSSTSIIGLISKPTLAQSAKSSKLMAGWIYFDVIKPDGYILHLQCYVKLSRAGQVTKALLGRFDLDSSRRRPMPSGELGSVHVSDITPNVVTFSLPLDELIEAENTVDDTPLRPLRGLPTKGLTIFSYVSHPQVVVSFSAGKDGRYHDGQPSPAGKPNNAAKFARSDHILGGVESLSTMLCVQHQDCLSALLQRSVSINPLSGLVTEGHKAHPLASTSDTPSIFMTSLNLAISYGFHDSRMGKRHSIYAYVTPDHSSWLSDLIDENEEWLNVPFSRLVLQGSHDAGMFTNLHPGFVQMITKMKLDADIGNFLIDHGISFVHLLTRLLKTFNIELERAICNIANTQKDCIYDQLRLGARFFDFRPGYCFHDCVNGQRGKIHHQHACVPGYKYVTALEETFRFLANHPREIVVFELKSDGFIARKTTWRKDSIPFHSMIPTRAALAGAIEEAKLNVSQSTPGANEINVGGPGDMDRKIGELLEAQVRLIVVHRMGEEPESGWDWQRDDSYDHNLYDSDRPEGILEALTLTHARNSIPVKPEILESSKTLPGTIYQLQATPTKSIADDIVTSLTYSKASSLLVYTKASVDPYTYAWVRERHFIEPGLVVLLNDFVDSVLTEHAIEKSRIRAGFFSSLSS